MHWILLIIVLAVILDSCGGSKPKYRSSYFEYDPKCSQLRSELRELDKQMAALVNCGSGFSGQCGSINAQTMEPKMARILQLTSGDVLYRCEVKGYDDLRPIGRRLAKNVKEAAAMVVALEAVADAYE